jgi:hypothetical protein
VPLPEAFSLTRLFIAPNAVPPDPTLTQDWVGGIMTTWDPISFANTVQVGPVVYRNLPVVSPNGLTVGTVLLAKAPGGYIVIGMLGTAKSVTLIDPIRYRSLRDDVSVTSSIAMADAGVLNFLLNVDTQYGVDGALYYNAGGTSHIKFGWTGPPNMACKWNTFGDISSGTDDFPIFDTVTAYGDASTQVIFGFGHSAVARPSAWFSTSDTGGLLQLRFSQSVSNATPAVLQAGSWLRISELGPASGATTFVKTYTCTGSRSYDGSGNPIATPDGDNNMYTWSLSGRGNGSERHMWTFPAATIRTDLAGATVLSAQMFLYCFDGSSFPADYNWKWSTTSAIAGTWPTNGFGGLDVKNVWAKNSWAGFDVTSELVNVLNNNANSVLGGSYNFTDSATAMRGFGFSATYRPYIEVTYAI